MKTFRLSSFLLLLYFSGVELAILSPEDSPGPDKNVPDCPGVGVAKSDTSDDLMGSNPAKITTDYTVSLVFTPNFDAPDGATFVVAVAETTGCNAGFLRQIDSIHVDPFTAGQEIVTYMKIKIPSYYNGKTVTFQRSLVDGDGVAFWSCKQTPVIIETLVEALPESAPATLSESELPTAQQAAPPAAPSAPEDNDKESNKQQPGSANTDPEILRELVPIGSTHLFLNTPYKLHVVDKPGCFATWFAGVLGTKTVRIVCTDKDRKDYYDALDASWVFERADGAEGPNPDGYYGPIKIRNLGSVSADGKTYVRAFEYGFGLGHATLAAYEGQMNKDMWQVTGSLGDSSKVGIEIQCPSNGRYLWMVDKADGGHRSWMALVPDSDKRYPFKFVPSIELTATLSNFKFTRPASEVLDSHSSKRDLMDSFEITNNGPTTLSRVVTVSKAVVDEFAWGLSQSLKVFAKVKGKAGIPFVIKSEIETGFELTGGATQNWKSSDTKTFQMSYTVNVPAYSTASIAAWYVHMKDVSMPYTSEAEITGTVSRMSKYDDLMPGSPATGEMIRKYLADAKFEDRVIRVLDDKVIVQVKGVMTASAGVKGHFSVNGKTVQDIKPK